MTTALGSRYWPLFSAIYVEVSSVQKSKLWDGEGGINQDRGVQKVQISCVRTY